jgi:hypothetical protein
LQLDQTKKSSPEEMAKTTLTTSGHNGSNMLQEQHLNAPKQLSKETSNQFINSKLSDNSDQKLSSIETLNAKISWATDELKSSNNVRYNIELCEMIKSASEAVISLKRKEL